MANEISITIAASQTNAGTTTSVNHSDTLSLGTGVTGKYSNTQTIGTSTEAIVVPADFDVSFIFLKNLDATNYVLIDYATPAVLSKLLPGEAMIFRPADNSAPVIYALANTAAIELQVICFGSEEAA